MAVNFDAQAWRFCVAPMLDWTTSECRLLHRQFSAYARLYTEMVTTGAVLYGDAARHLSYRADEYPVALQLGGGNVSELARACELANAYGYDEINLNVGCPSDRVQNNAIGACLMADAPLVARCLQAMQETSDAVVTVKHRLAIDEQDESEVLRFVETLASGSRCRVFIVHARKAWLAGLNPKQNREVPPLNYDLVYELKRRFPELVFVINGGITSMAAVREHLQVVDGVMVGRAAYQNPELLLEVDALFGAPLVSLEQVLERIEKVMARELARGVPFHWFTRHLLGLFQGRVGARRFRRLLSERSREADAGLALWQEAVSLVRWKGV